MKPESQGIFLSRAQIYRTGTADVLDTCDKELQCGIHVGSLSSYFENKVPFERSRPKY